MTDDNEDEDLLLAAKMEVLKGSTISKVAEDMVDCDPLDLARFIEKYEQSRIHRSKEYEVEVKLKKMESDFED